eukprot:362672-Chlamydomonas_euryale.AAC.7
MGCPRHVSGRAIARSGPRPAARPHGLLQDGPASRQLGRTSAFLLFACSSGCMRCEEPTDHGSLRAAA